MRPALPSRIDFAGARAAVLASPRRLVAILVLALGPMFLLLAWERIGLSPAGLGLLALLGAAGFVAMMAFVPQALVVLVPAVLALPLNWPVLPYEMLLWVLAVVVLLQGLERRALWVWRLVDIEIANLVVVGWALFSGFWSEDKHFYLMGVRNVAIGSLSLWVAYRLSRLVPLWVFELSVVAGAVALSMSVDARWAGSGFDVSHALAHRATTTFLGWGGHNLVASILLLSGPCVFWLATRRPRAWMHNLGWAASGLIVTAQAVIVSRASLAMYFVGGVFQVSKGRQRVLGIGLFLLLSVLFLFTPFGAAFLRRLVDPREQASVTIRLWYFRQAWRRGVEFFPWGLGAYQGWVYPDALYGKGPHNYWLVLFSELGIFGLAGWTALLGLLWRHLRVMRSDPKWSAAGLALQVVFVSAQLVSLVEGTFYLPQYQFVFFWLMGGYLGYFHMDLISRAAAPIPHAMRDPGYVARGPRAISSP